MKKLLLKTIAIELTVLFVVSIGSYIQTAEAARSYTVHNVPEMTLKTALSTTQTANIQINAPQRNNASVLYPTTTGGILEFKSLSKTEYIYYSSATVNSSTKVITLAGVVRGYCWDRSIYASCEAGQSWSPGTKIRLVVDMRLLNRALKSDIQNTLTESGRIIGTATGHTIFSLNPATTTQRNAFTTLANGDIFYNSTLGVIQARLGGAWNTLGGSGTVNIGFGNAGKAQLATPAQVFSQTASGSSLAGLVVAAKDVVHNSGSTASAGATSNVVATSGSTIDSSLIAVSPGSGDLLQVQSNGDITGKSTSQLGISTGFKHEATVTAASADVGAGTTVTGSLVPTWTGTGVDANSLIVGSAIHIKMGGIADLNVAAGYVDLILRIGGVFVGAFTHNISDADDYTWDMDVEVNIRTIGASGTAMASGVLSLGRENIVPTGTDSQTINMHSMNATRTPNAQFTIDTTALAPVSLSVHFQTANGSNFMNVQTGSITVTRP